MYPGIRARPTWTSERRLQYCTSAYVAVVTFTNECAKSGHQAWVALHTSCPHLNMCTAPKPLLRISCGAAGRRLRSDTHETLTLATSMEYPCHHLHWCSMESCHMPVYTLEGHCQSKRNYGCFRTCMRPLHLRLLTSTGATTCCVPQADTSMLPCIWRGMCLEWACIYLA